MPVRNISVGFEDSVLQQIMDYYGIFAIQVDHIS